MQFLMAEKYRAKHPLGWKHGPGDRFGFYEIPSEYDGKIL